MIINMSVDIEEEIRNALKEYVTTYVRPLPEKFKTPSILIELMGGTSENTIDTFTVRLSSRAETDAESLELLRVALGILEQQTINQVGELRFSNEQSLMSWGTDPIRPELKLSTATINVVAHKIKFEIDES